MSNFYLVRMSNLKNQLGTYVSYYQNPYLSVRFDHTTKNMVKHTRLVKTIGFVECITEALNFDCFSFVVKILNNACKYQFS